MGWLTAFLDGIKLRARYLWGLAIGAGAVLFIPRAWSKSMSLEGARDALGPVFGILFVFSIVFAAIRSYDALEESRRSRGRRRALFDRLGRLTPNEARILRDAYRSGHQTVFLPLNGATPRALTQKGLLQASDPNAAAAPVSSWPHVIPDEVWELLGTLVFPDEGTSAPVEAE